MFRPFGAFWQALKDLLEEFVLLAICNVLWALMSLPLLVVAFSFLLGGGYALAAVVWMLAVLPMAPATAGLFAVCYRVTEGRASKIADFVAGMRRYAVPAWQFMTLWALGFLIIVVDVVFYAGAAGLLATVVLGLWLYLLVIWMAVLMYAFPLMQIQTTPALRMTARNAFVMALGRPFFTLTTLALMLGLLVLSYFFYLLVPLITVALWAMWSTRATFTLVKESEERRAAAESAISPPPPGEEKGRRGQVRPK